MKQTAIDYFFNELQRMQYFIGNDMLEAYKQAKQMEKEQMKKTWLDSTMQFDTYAEMNNKKLFDDYYNENYGSGMSEKPTDHIVDTNEMVDHKPFIDFAKQYVEQLKSK